MRLTMAVLGFSAYAVLISCSAGFCCTGDVLPPRLYAFSSSEELASKDFPWRFFSGAEPEKLNYAGSLSAFPYGEAVLLMWALRDGASVEGYNVYVSLGRDAGWRFEPVASLPRHKTEYSHRGLTGSMRYYYIVTAVDRYGAETLVTPYAAYACPGTGEFGISEMLFDFLTGEKKNENHWRSCGMYVVNDLLFTRMAAG